MNSDLLCGCGWLIRVFAWGFFESVRSHFSVFPDDWLFGVDVCCNLVDRLGPWVLICLLVPTCAIFYEGQDGCAAFISWWCYSSSDAISIMMPWSKPDGHSFILVYLHASEMCARFVGASVSGCCLLLWIDLFSSYISWIWHYIFICYQVLNHMIYSILCYGSMMLSSDLIMYISSRLLVALHAMYHYKTSSVTSCYKPFFYHEYSYVTHL